MSTGVRERGALLPPRRSGGEARGAGEDAPLERRAIAAQLTDARRRTLALLEDLSDAQLVVPKLPIVNPLLWELGHVGWFQERWLARHAYGQPPQRADSDALYDSRKVAHDLRWERPLPSRAETLRELANGLAALLGRLDGDPGEPPRYFFHLATFHEDMHGEALVYTRQTLGYPGPAGATPPGRSESSRAEGDVEIPAGTFSLGSPRGQPFVFDNEKWAHPREVAAFAIARTAVTQAEFADFVQSKGYERPEHWSPEGWSWRTKVAALAPLHWRREGTQWLRRHFDRWLPLEPDLPVTHVSWFEAEAFCRWAGRRLPTELEWEVAAVSEPDGRGGLGASRRRFPWGDAPPSPATASLDGALSGPRSVHDLGAGDSGWGCRQLLGNAWEWTSSEFAPYPGFSADPYEDYSRPWFGSHKVLRGGSWTTRSRLIRPEYRNFYTPERRDVIAGFRTCAR
ncbi:MAG: selenoneine synthase SenA [Deltaproteobacteria bacterium]